LNWSTYWVISAIEKRIPLSVATHWSGVGFEPHQIVCLYQLFGDDVETARTWQDLSIGTMSNNSIAEVVTMGLSRDEVDRWMAVGADLREIPQALRQGLTMEEVDQWRTAGFVFSQAAPALERGATLDDALAFLAAGYTRWTDKPSISVLLQLGVRGAEAKAFGAIGADLSGIKLYTERSLSAKQVEGWLAQGVDNAYIFAFSNAGIKEPIAMADWLAEGFSPSDVVAYVQGGIDAGTAAQWRARGFLAVEAIARARDGETYEASKPPLTDSTWHVAFSRSRLDRDIFVVSAGDDVLARFWSACRSLGVPSSLSVLPYGTHHQAYPFLDGGVVDVSPPYSRRLTGTWVMGFDALCLLCYRLGLTPPSFRDHGVARSYNELEQDLKVQRSHHGPALKGRLEELLRICSGDGLRSVAAALRAEAKPIETGPTNPGDERPIKQLGTGETSERESEDELESEEVEEDQFQNLLDPFGGPDEPDPDLYPG